MVKSLFVIVLRHLYYEKNETMIFVPKEIKTTMIDYYLLNDLKTNVKYWFVDEEYTEKIVYIDNNMFFLPDANNTDIYINTEGVRIIKVKNNKYYKIQYEYEDKTFNLGEEWIFLMDKRSKAYDF